jgi:hypothetical protein
MGGGLKQLFTIKCNILSINKKDIKTRWEEDYHLIDGSGLFEEYLEMGRIKKKFVLLI